jgi:hypothetical protein
MLFIRKSFEVGHCFLAITKTYSKLERRMRARKILLYFAFALVLMSSIATGLGGLSDMTGRPFSLVVIMHGMMVSLQS